MKTHIQLSTGLPGLDKVLRGLMPGDNLVWQINSIDDYRPFIRPYFEYAREHRQKFVYFRFADHPPLLKEGEEGLEKHRLDSARGFDRFLADIHNVINHSDRGTCYLFDCLSELAPDWRSDRMLGNFFMLTCPYLYDRAAVAYFAIFQNYHSFHALKPISTTTQILLNVHRHDEKLFIHPIKVQHRHSATMYMLHEHKDGDFIPVTQSATIAEVISHVPWSGHDSATNILGYWSKTCAEAEAVQSNILAGIDTGGIEKKYFQQLLRMMISHDERVLSLAEKYFSFEDLLAVRRRMTGTGLIGGKAVGMLLARAILRNKAPKWARVMEPHDSFFVGSDVFYTYLVQNGYWWMVKHHQNETGRDDSIEIARRRILTGDFPEYIIEQFSDMLDYFGQSPIIVRSSSILEDNFDNAFAGKYESVFCANQGGKYKRLEDFLSAVRAVYASTLSEDAVIYRHQKGFRNHDERMALLIQRVSGGIYGNCFFPQAAGVGFSFNPYVWHESIDPSAGMIRIVFGVGTRAVDRSDDDYTRIVALNAPSRRPEATFDKVQKYSQRRVDVIDLEANHLTSKSFEEVLARSEGIPIEMFASQETPSQSRTGLHKPPADSPWVLTFDRLLEKTDFVPTMRELLAILQEAYEYPIDVEFTLNFFDDFHYKLNLVQCRPLQIMDRGTATKAPENIAEEDVILESRGTVIGKSTTQEITWILYVVPETYSQLSNSDRYEIARAVGKLCRSRRLSESHILLMGPGRWGTTTPSLGVPVSFFEIRPVSALCEIVTMHENLIPDVSLGTHFFNELVENSILYMALLPEGPKNRLNKKIIESNLPNRITEIEPELAEWSGVIRVIKADDAGEGRKIILNANTLDQKVLCYVS